MSQSWRNPDSDDEDNEDDEELTFSGRDAIIFLIDCAKSMFETVNDDYDQKSKFRVAMECIEVVLRNRIIMSDTDLVNN